MAIFDHLGVGLESGHLRELDVLVVAELDGEIELRQRPGIALLVALVVSHIDLLVVVCRLKVAKVMVAPLRRRPASVAGTSAR